jgi:hypothetical protein
MKWTPSVMPFIRRTLLFALGMAVFSPCSVRANTIEITFSGMDIVYDGNAIYDAGSNAGGLADPADADPLLVANFSQDGSLVGSIASDISLDLYIPDITGIPAAANTHHVLLTPGNPGFLDLLIGTSPLASEFLLLDLNEVSITYLDAAGTVQFTFGAAVASSASQNLPFGLVAHEPITVSFSAQIVPGTLTEAGGVVTGFLASGTGEIRGVPEPATYCLMVAAGLALAAYRRIS